MISLASHIERVKGKPHHIRRQVAFAVAAVGATLIALVWATISIATNSFAIQGSNFAESTGQVPAVATGSNANAGLAGAAGAAAGQSEAAGIEIIDTGTSSTLKPASEPTVIPF